MGSRGASEGFVAVAALGVSFAFFSFFPPQVEGAQGSPEHFLFQGRGECHFLAPPAAHGSPPPDGQPKPPPPRVRYIQRYAYGREEYVRFDSDLGQFVAVTPLGEPDAQYWNSQKETLDYLRSQVDAFCRYDYGITEEVLSRRKVQPTLKIIPMDYDASSHNTMLICSLHGFFPPKIDIKWFRNGKEEGKVMTTDLTQNGDWTYQIQVMLETKPERGDVYACQVEHASFATLASVEWTPQSDSARSKMWTGVVGLVLGVVFVAAGLSFYLRNKKGRAVPPTTVGLMD